MTRKLTFRSLWLVSEKEGSARKVLLNKPKILLLGVNGTGKSRIVKNIFWALGCDPQKKDAGSWNPDTIAVLEFEFDGRLLTAIRAGKKQGLFSSDGKLLFATSSHSEWSEFVSELFNYRLRLQRPNSEKYGYAGLDYLSVPFYIDQDGSWGPQWVPFKNLTQFSNWKAPVFSSFSGQRPNVYLEAKQKRDDIKGHIASKKSDLDSQRGAFHRVMEMLPRSLPSLDMSSFRSELIKLADRAKNVHGRQAKLRNDLVDAINKKQKIQSELELVKNAQRELVGDLQFLSGYSDGSNIECPTCGTMHGTSFHARLALGSDAEAMAGLAQDLSKQNENIRSREASIRKQLKEIEGEIRDFDVLSNEKRGRLKLDDVIASHSKKTLDRAFFQVADVLERELVILQSKYNELNEQVKRFEDRERLQTVSEYYSAKLRSLSDFLNIPPDERVDETKLGSRPDSGGSSGPRAILAIHLAMLASNVEFGDTVCLPFVVDTPQQSGQDENNLRKMIEAIERYAAPEHQIILALERLPENANVSDFFVINLEGKNSLLNKESFPLAFEALKDRVQLLREYSDAIEANEI